MSLKFTVVAFKLIMLTGPGGQMIEVNPGKIVALREPRSTEHFAPNTRCLVFTSDGKFLTVREPCLEIQQKIEGGD